MERVVQIYIEGDRVELFKDEEISLNSSIQNIADISKIYTDFTQSFSVPASPSNNVIMRHFYNSEVILYENEFTNPSLRRNATIEIDGTFFKRGRIQLENAKIENGEPYSYTLTFYGELVSLKDTFGEEKLSDLDWSSLSHAYTYSDIKARIEDGATNYDVRYPLISSSRYWQYNNSTTPDENIDTTQGAIVWTELFPAVKIKAIFNLLESIYNITLQGSFLDDPKFTSAYTFFKNSETSSFVTPAIPLEFVDVYAGGVTYAPPFPYTNSDDGVTYDDTDNSITLAYTTYELIAGSFTDAGMHTIQAEITNISPSNVTYYIDVYRYNQLHNTITIDGGGDASVIVYEEDNTNNPNINSKLTFFFRSDAPVTCDIRLVYFLSAPLLNQPNIPINFRYVGCNSITTATEQNLQTSAPDMKVSDYFANVLKLFNLTAYGLEKDVYELETIESWYNKGEIIDITEYTDMKSIDVKRIKLFKNITFKYAQSKSVTNRFFYNTYMREYGDLASVFNYEGGDYKIEIGFENIQFSKFTDTNLQVAYCIDPSLNPYVPAPVTLYQYTNQSVSFYLTDELTNTDEITSYVPFGQDMIQNNENFTLNWGSENSTLLQTQLFGGLYNTYYKGYIENLYDPKNREITVKTRLPLSILTSLDLNDRVVIRDKRYIINNIKASLTSGETTLVLINDFRRMIADGHPPIYPPIRPDDDAQCMSVLIPFIKNAVSCTIAECTTPSVSGVTITPSTITSEQFVTICIPAWDGSNTKIITETGGFIIDTEEGEDFVTEESEGIRTIAICLTYTMNDGSSVANQIFIQQGATY